MKTFPLKPYLAAIAFGTSLAAALSRDKRFDLRASGNHAIRIPFAGKLTTNWLSALS